MSALNDPNDKRVQEWMQEIRASLRTSPGNICVMAPDGALRRLRDSLTPAEWYRIDVYEQPAPIPVWSRPA